VTEPALPRGVRLVALPLGCLVLTLVFAAALFPWERYRSGFATWLGAATGASVEVASMGGGLSLAGPVLEAGPLRATWPDGRVLDVERARVRPAWALSWLRGVPSIHLDLDGSSGNVEGTLRAGADAAFVGEIEGLDLGRLPFGSRLGEAPLTGLLDAEIDVTSQAGAWAGEVRFQARDGSLATAELPMAVPFETLTGALVLGQTGDLEVRDVALAGPMVALRASGSVGAAANPGRAPLALEVDLEVADPNLRPMVASVGIPLDGQGRARLNVGGTLASPALR
jgi:type II secretion system protein N